MRVGARCLLLVLLLRALLMTCCRPPPCNFHVDMMVCVCVCAHARAYVSVCVLSWSLNRRLVGTTMLRLMAASTAGTRVGRHKDAGVASGDQSACIAMPGTPNTAATKGGEGDGAGQGGEAGGHGERDSESSAAEAELIRCCGYGWSLAGFDT